MNDLMLHVERIVRPVRALQSRKLRMRRELLAHMQNAVDEERAGGADEPVAIARAKERIGEPAELTRSLQSSVPAIERTLLARMPASKSVDRLENRVGRFWGLDQTMTMAHAAVFILGTFILTYTALLIIAMQLPPYGYAASFRNIPRVVTVNLVAIVMFGWLWKSAADICITATLSPRPLSGFASRAIRVLTLVIVFMYLYIDVLAQYNSGARNLIVSLSSGVALLASVLILGSILRLVRRRYDEWLTLDIAG